MQPEQCINEPQIEIPKKCKILKSRSLSNIPKSISSIPKRRCYSVPPIIIMIQYDNRNRLEIGNDLSSANRELSLSLSALTCDYTKDVGRKRSNSVPPQFRFHEFIEGYQKTQVVDLINPKNETYSYDGDYSDDVTDCDYYLSDVDQSLRLFNDETSTSSGICHGNLNEGRNRLLKAEPKTWKKIKNKKLRMLGQEYLGYTKPSNRKMRQDKIRPARQLGDRCNSQFCKKSNVRNCEKFNDEIRMEIHNCFWKQMNWDQRKVYVAGLVTRKKTTRKTSGQASRREGTFDYFLPIDECQKLQVCRTTFLNTLCLGSFTVQSWVKKAHCGVIPCQEIQNIERVTTPRSGTKRKLLTAHNFLNNIPKLPSHYARRESSRLYLEPTFRSLSDLYNKYKEYCAQNEEPFICRFTFEKVFRDKNLSLYILKKDMCDVCSGHAVGNISTTDYEEHIRRKNRARQEKEIDKKKATSGEFILLSMDLESVKVCPYLTASALYFKTKLTCHNFTVYDLVTHHATCYWFDETAADLTASTFVSYVCDYLERHCLPKQLPIVIYSDGCTYQNRNNIMANALLNFSIEHNVTIMQKYLEPGHTQMECDSVHSAIERKLKNREIHLPSDYITATKEARRNPTPYETVEVTYSSIKDYNDKSTWRYSSIRPGRKVGDHVVVDLRAIQYTSEGIINFKINFDDDWSEMPGRPKRINLINYSPLRTAPIPIASTKFNHLQQLKDVLPRDCHSFYDNLVHN